MSARRLGIYTSATYRNASAAIIELLGSLQATLDTLDREDNPGFPATLPPQLFDIVMCREHCVLASKVTSRFSRIGRLASVPPLLSGPLLGKAQTFIKGSMPILGFYHFIASSPAIRMHTAFPLLVIAAWCVTA